MSLRSVLVLSSIGFAVLYTASWYWSNPPENTGKTVILIVAGALAGLAWFSVLYFIKYVATKYLGPRTDRIGRCAPMRNKAPFCACRCFGA
jgi:hypothetical protein